MISRQHSGFTLLEMVIAMTALSLLAVLVTPYLNLSVRAYTTNAATLQVLAELRYASERIVRELREIRRNPLSPSDYEIVTPLSASNITFVRNDGESVTIESAASQLNLRYGSVAHNAPFPLTTSLQNLTFNFLRRDETTFATGGNDLAYIEFEIQLTANNQTYSQRSRVALRAQP